MWSCWTEESCRVGVWGALVARICREKLLEEASQRGPAEIRSESPLESVGFSADSHVCGSKLRP